MADPRDEEEQHRSGRYSKLNCDKFVANFCDDIYEKLGQGGDEGTLTKEQVKVTFKTLMEIRDRSVDWDEKEFDILYNKFEDDE